MNPSLAGFGFLAGYVVMVGVASFLEKFSMKQLNPYQVNFLMAIGMAVTAIPACGLNRATSPCQVSHCRWVHRSAS
jgi:biotin transporter BioY